MAARQASPRGLAWYREAKFGMFVHWGLYALRGKGEWDMFESRTPVAEYEQLMRRLEADQFDAERWADLAQDAGQRYITITSRHHDGFSMYDTALSDFKVTNTPFGRDPIAELAEACAKRGIKLGCYVSLIDWHHPAFRFRRESGLAWDDYLGFLHGQVEELCTRYGEIGQVWFDGDWPRSKWWRAHPDWFAPGGDYNYPALYDLVHRLQPDAVVLNNRKDVPLPPGEDVQGFENDLPGENTAGFNTGTVLDGPKETCLTMNKSWGYQPEDDAYRSTDDLLAVLKRAWAAGCNLLLNVGPQPDGRIPAREEEILRAIAAHLKRFD
ncbi:alpha-L-fucosidase [Micromonospora sp. DR5-3]|uniref:alpha-L-fucosidase n=1 Tax=unclassified Micromonospora TaxID=2617518 RepID=UPI0011D8274E|nr:MULTISPECIES: alpha-L-fucosidase [unclassified Micromonospora]MCW3815971.1 alpha-L-fucosidase [Micromonospora sp. DR5-3]TYC20837.1 alpha-L-fucosidase [Micromonospora sp. MP36]